MRRYFTAAKADVLFVYLAYSLRYVYLFALIPFYARVLGTEGYGVVLAAMSLMQIIWLIVNWGFSITGTREIATAQPHEYAEIFNGHLSGRTMISFIAFVIGAIAVYFSNVLSQHLLAGLFAVLLGIISAFNLGWYFTGSGRPRATVKLEVLGFILNLALILSLVKKPDDSWLAVFSLFCSGCISLGIAHWWVRHEIIPIKLNLKAGLARIQAAKSIFIFSSISIVLGASSSYLLSTLSTNTEVGYFGSAERLVSAGLSVMSPIGAVFAPKVMRLLNEDSNLAFWYIRKLLLFMLTIALIGLILCEFAAEPIIHLIFGAQFYPSAPILKCMAIVFPFYAVSLILGSYILIPLHHDKLMAKIALVSAIANIVIAVPLAIEHGGIGMAIARVISEMIMCTYLLFACANLDILKKLRHIDRTY